MMDARFSRGTRALPGLAALAVTLALAACASPASRFYTLGAGSGPTGSETASADRTADAKPALLFELAPVDVPSQVARSQLVVEAGNSRVDVLEQERWASPPADEIRHALSGDLAARLGTFDVYGASYPAGVPVYRVTVTVRRFESWPGERAVLGAVWSVRAVGSQSVLTCRTVETVPVAAGYAALVEGHRRAVAQTADRIAAVVLAQRGQARPVRPADVDCTAGSPPPAK